MLEDQRLAYDDMRERCPVARSDFMGWSLFRHEDVVGVLGDPETYSSASRHTAIPNGMDPPTHGRHREALAPLFSEDQMASIEPRYRQIASELLEPMGGGEAELMESFATPFTLRTLCAFLGWSEELWEGLGGWTHGNQQAAFTRDPAAGRALAQLLSEHVRAILEEHRAHPVRDGDVTDSLLATSVGGVALDDDDIVSVLRNWIAGEGTVAGGISLLVLHLAEHADLQDQLRTDPSLIPSAIEEILRVDDRSRTDERPRARWRSAGARSRRART